MDWNSQILVKINGLSGRNKWLDAFGRAGAEWVILAILAWYVAGVFITKVTWPQIITPFVILSVAWLVGLLLNFIIGKIIKEPRPYLTNPEIKLLFVPLSGWKSFPSDHAMSVFLILFFGLLFHLPAVWSLLPLALWVAWGRLYAGLHYPLDIIGGICVAGLLAIVLKYVVSYFVLFNLL
ncbi:MAG: hypothetical protein COU29_01095 [Candidatus Magasanikbacteria bacterium CG10_big_fil_rev_8_21_14_0_10_36_32]|uniref:Phosphatidic acid phosphatase type 2/haloperoxidase domain-containing protein n=1 Tax=Candidatus Magasanikbacteria bacterium CG10_big_fil_rev_8_21_14_0_10_36_32 TaxID=1974646 RepID=A0A2M6W6H6_9BACT|nr:MAG: hypothetical protein COU29_01095 [Candidatus Magasanikbacteria bacterium CG10_big_fil_rev_8_21_14_0_10_36_32]